MQDRTEVPDATELVNTILPSERLHDRPDVGLVEEDKVTVPLKPLAAATTILEVAGPPAGTTRDGGVIDTVKS